jgi:negative regulator of sigma E activity
MEISERISALLDNAGDAGDQAQLGEIAQDPAARQTWARYQLIGDSLRGTVSPINSALSARVSAALAHEPLVPSEIPKVIALKPRRWQPQAAAGLAAAAAVAAFMIFGGSLRPTVDSPPALAVQAGISTRQMPPDSSRVSVLSEKEYQQRINSYLVNFNAQRAQLGVPKVPPYVRVVDFEAAPQQ